MCIIGVVLATTFIVAIGSTTMRYATVIKEMNVLFSGRVIVVSKNAIVIQAIPLGGGMIYQNEVEEGLQEVSGVEKITPILLITGLGIGSSIQAVPVNFSMGIPVQDWRLILGPTPLKDNVGSFPKNESGNEVAVGISLADQYNWTVGKEMTVNNHKLKVAGILDTRLALLSRCIVMPLELEQEVYNEQDSVNIIAVTPKLGYSQRDLADAIEEKVTYVNALTEDERYDMIQPILDQVEAWNVGIQTVVFLMSLILVMTVTIMSVSERRRDFATLDAIGAPLSYIFRLVLIETSLIGILGATIGLVCGSLTAISIASLFTNIPISQFFPSVFEIVPPFYMLEIFVAVVFVCCLGGMLPAINATKTRIAETLRAEY